MRREGSGGITAGTIRTIAPSRAGLLTGRPMRKEVKGNTETAARYESERLAIYTFRFPQFRAVECLSSQISALLVNRRFMVS